MPDIFYFCRQDAEGENESCLELLVLANNPTEAAQIWNQEFRDWIEDFHQCLEEDGAKLLWSDPPVAATGFPEDWNQDDRIMIAKITLGDSTLAPCAIRWHQPLYPNNATLVAYIPKR